MANYDDIDGGLPLNWQPDPAWVPPAHWGFDAAAPDAPLAPSGDVAPGAVRTPVVSDLATTPAPVTPAAPPPLELQPGIGIPQAALDSSVPMGPELGPQPEGVLPPSDAPPAEAPPPPVPMPWSPPSDPAPFGPAPAPTVGDVPGLSFSADDPRARTTPNPLDNPDDDAVRQYVERASQQQLLDLQRQQDVSRRTKLLLDQARIEDEQLAQLRADQAAHARANAITQAKSDAIVADAVKLGNTKTDPERWMRTRSGGQRVAAFVAAIGGGLVQGRTGAANNAGLDAIQRDIDRDIDAQKADIENGKYAIGVRSNAVAQEFQRNGDLYRAAETVRLATYQAAINKMQTEQQNYDPRGTAFINYGLAIKSMQAHQAAATETMRKTIFEEEYKVAQLRQSEQAQADARWKARQEVSIAWTKEAREGKAAKAAATVWTPEQLRVINPGLPTPPIAMTQDDYAKWLQAQKHGEDYKAAARENSPEDRNRRFGVGEIVDNTGAPVQFRNDTVATAVGNSKAAADSAVGLIDKLVAARRKYGWSSDLVKSAEWRKMTADFQQLLVTKKEQDNLGVIAGPDMAILGGSLGTTDPTETKDPIPGLLEARSNIVEAVNTKVRAQAVLPAGRTIARWEPPQLAVDEARPTELDQALTRLKAKPDVDAYDARIQAGHDWIEAHPELPRDNLGKVVWSDDVREQYRAAGEAAEKERHEISPQQRRDLAQLSARIVAGDAIAKAVLDDVAKTAHSRRVRAIAEGALNTAVSTAARKAAPEEPPAPAAEPAFVPRFDRPAQPTFPAPSVVSK